MSNFGGFRRSAPFCSGYRDFCDSSFKFCIKFTLVSKFVASGSDVFAALNLPTSPHFLTTRSQAEPVCVLSNFISLKFVRTAYQHRVCLLRRRMKFRDLTARNQSSKNHPPRSKAPLASTRLSAARRRALAVWRNTARRLRLRRIRPRIFETSSDPHRR